ncbi:MAG TPA: IS91 family transposase [Methylocystis sp.]|nr:IS91 family transposase [Methylocystis sp.]
MERPALELADVFRRHGDAYLREHAAHLGRGERRVMGAIAACRTAALGGHVEQCDACGLTRVAYNSCRNRHCPKCQGAARAAWLCARKSELLPVPYFHLVFTLPPQAAEIAFQNKALVYALLMRSAAEATMTLAENPKRLGAKIGLLAVLHTWGQTLTHHPHVHCVVPGGGLSLDGQRWIACKPGFFLPVKPLARLFRRLFLAGLDAAFKNGALRFFGDLAPLAESHAFAARLRSLRQTDWIVYAKPPFGGPQQVLAYLARYTHRAAIANSRLVAVSDKDVAFSYKDYRRNGRHRVMRLEPDEFIRRFLLHILPDGFHRIRHYGLLARGDRAERLELCRELANANQPAKPNACAREDAPAVKSDAVLLCPDCGALMRRIGVTPPFRRSPFFCDTS